VQSAEILFESFAYNRDKLVWAPSKMMVEHMLPKGFAVDGCAFELKFGIFAFQLLLLLLFLLLMPLHSLPPRLLLVNCLLKRCQGSLNRRAPLSPPLSTNRI
jgi:hypothetical protein